MRQLKTIILPLFIAIFSGAMASAPPTAQRAIELYRDGRWIDSRLALLEAKAQVKDGNYTDAETIDFYLAMCAVELDDPQAEQWLEDFGDKYPQSARANKISFAKAMLYCSEERYGQAKEQFGRVKYSTLTFDEREKYDVRMGYISFLEGDYASAREYLSKIDKQSDIYHHALYYTSYVDYIEQDNVAARKGFTELLSSDAYSQVAPFYLLQIEFNDGRYDQVLRDGQALYSQAVPSRQMELSRSMAEAAFRVEKFGDAIVYMEQYRALGGVMSREENYILGFSLYREVRHSEALEYLREACGADDELTQNASYHLADCYLKAADKSSAAVSFAMAANDTFSSQIAEDALFNYAKLQYELGSDRFSETINVLTRYLNKYPSSGYRYEQAKELLIAAYYNSRNYDAAYKSISELKSPDSDIRLALQRITLYRGLESYNRGDFEVAMAQFEESLTVNISPKYSSIARFYLGEIDFATLDYIGALENYNAYIISAPKSDENYPLALYNIGYAKLMLDSDSEALGYFERFLESTPDDTFYRADAYNRTGDILYSKRQFSDAKAKYQRSTWSKFEPRHYALYQTAIIDGIMGAYSAKVERLKTIISIGEGGYVEQAMYELGRSYIAASDYKGGVETHERFIERYPSSDKYAQALSDLGLAYLNLGDRSSSLNYYDRAIKAAPQSSVAKDALQGVREIYINNGDANGYFNYASSVGHSGDLSSMAKDSLSFASAQRLYLNSEGSSQTAINALTEYVRDYPQGYYTVDALFFLSDSYAKSGKSEQAITTLQQLEKRGANQYSERVYDKLSTLLSAQKQYSQAAESYLKLYQITNKADVKSRALTGYSDATIAAADDNATLSMAEFVLGRGDADDQLLVKVKHAKAKVLMTNGDSREALKIFRELSLDPQSIYGAESVYIIIESEFEAGSVDSAEQMIFDFAQSETPYSQYLARAFIILGDIYVLRGDNFQARATYQSIIDGYVDQNDNIIEQTRAKIDKLQ